MIYAVIGGRGDKINLIIIQRQKRGRKELKRRKDEN